MSHYFGKFFSKYQGGFRQGLSVPYCLISLVEKWTKSINNGKTFAALLTILSKALDCLPYDFIIVTLDAYGFSLSPSRLIHSFLLKQKQRTKIISAYSTAQKMKFSIKDFFSKCDQIRRKLWIWSHLLKKTLMESFIFCAV